MSKCKTVTLRKRKIKNGTQYSLCLDYYPGYRGQHHHEGDYT